MKQEPAGAAEDLRGFLAAVDHEVIELGVRDHVDVRRLVGSRPQWKPEELRDALAALLATDKDQLERIQRLFDLHLAAHRASGGAIARKAETKAPEPGQVGAPPAPASRAPGRLRALLTAPLGRRGQLLGAAAALALIVGIVVATRSGPNAPAAPQAPAATAPPAPAVEAPADSAGSKRDPDEQILRPETVIDYEHPGARRKLDAIDVLALLLGGALLMLAIRWGALPRAAERERKQWFAARSERARAERRRLTEEAAARGDPIRLSYNVPLHLPMRPQALDDAAVLLGRTGPREPGRDLDVRATLGATLRQGGRLVAVFEERRAAREILVLIDEERGSHPWLGGISRALDHLARAGVALRRYRFQHVPAWLTPELGGAPIAIEELSRRYAGAHLLVFSRRLSPEAREGEARWIGELPAWPVKAWIDPDPRPLGERGNEKRAIERLTALGLRRFPWTAEGLGAAAAFLASGGEPSPEPPWPELPDIADPPVAEALRRWALSAALVPDADWDQLEAIRRHPDFAEIRDRLPEPFHLQRLLNWTAETTGDDAEAGDGRTLWLPEDAVDRLIREQRRKERGVAIQRTLEARARRLLLEQLESERPTGELLRLRWTLKVASHRLVLEPGQAARFLEDLFGSAVDEEARVIAAVELDRQSNGLALAGCAMSRAAMERLRAHRGEGRWIDVRGLFKGHRRLYALAALGVAAMAAGLVIGSLRTRSGRLWLDGLLRSPRVTFRAKLPETLVDRLGELLKAAAPPRRGTSVPVRESPTATPHDEPRGIGEGSKDGGTQQ